MSLYDAVLAVLLSLPRFHTELDEPDAKRLARLEKAALAIVHASEKIKQFPQVETAAALLSQGNGETHFAAYVGEGRCQDGPKGARCDPDRHGKARARTYWQNWEVSCPKAWTAEPGSQAELDAGAYCTARLMTGGFFRCRANGSDPWTGAFSGMRGGAICVARWAPSRVKHMKVIAGQLYAKTAPAIAAK